MMRRMLWALCANLSLLAACEAEDAGSSPQEAADAQPPRTLADASAPALRPDASDLNVMDRDAAADLPAPEMADAGMPDPEMPDPEQPDPEQPDADLPEPDAEPPAPDAEPPEPPACPEGVECLRGPHFEIRGDTTGGPSRLNAYGCAPDTDESGPERLYRLDLDEAGFLALSLSEMAEGADVDVHLLADAQPDACLDRGHWRAGRWVEPGTYWIAADSWVNGDGQALPGAFTLTGHLTTPADLRAEGVDPRLAEEALRAFSVAWGLDQTDRFEYAVIDFSMHSAERRQWVLDLATGDLLWRLHVAHGEASAAEDDPGWSVRFSNVPESHQSSLGMLRTAEAYVGDFGVSYRLDGLEPGFNDNVRRRDIVMHPWDESRPEYVDAYGIAGTTWGCPGVDDRVAPAVVEALSGGSLMLFWHPESQWHEASVYTR